MENWSLVQAEERWPLRQVLLWTDAVKGQKIEERYGLWAVSRGFLTKYIDKEDDLFSFGGVW